MKVLFIDDEGVNSVGAAVDELRNEGGVESCVEPFEGSDSALSDWRPDIVVLDLSKKGATQENANPGLQIRDRIWKNRFCPIIYYTANTYLLDGMSPHPLVSTVAKGNGSELQVLQSVKSMRPYTEALNKLNEEIESSTREALRDTATSVFEATAAGERKDILIRTVRRRVAARMDYAPFTDDLAVLHPWEHYLAPSPSQSLLTGDILRKQDSDHNDPCNYAVVLTPSCDLVAGKGRKPKVTHALVACCCPVDRLLSDLRVEVSSKRDKIKDRLMPSLTQGYAATCIPLPALLGQFPSMAADLKNLQLISIDENDGKPLRFDCVASMDNPFREMVAWAYAASAGRPGLPDRDFEAWAEEIMDKIKPPQQTQPAKTIETQRTEAARPAVPTEEGAETNENRNTGESTVHVPQPATPAAEVSVEAATPIQIEEPLPRGAETAKDTNEGN